MPRRHRPPRGRPPTPPAAALEPAALGGWMRVEGDEGEWVVRSVSGSAATKPYRCPGCDQEIVPRTPHVVAWPADDPEGSAERRHWHTGCWRRRRR